MLQKEEVLAIDTNNEPEFTSQPFNLPQYQSHVEVGTFIQYQSNVTREQTCVGRVIKSMALYLVCVNHFLLNDDLKKWILVSKRFPLGTDVLWYKNWYKQATNITFLRLISEV